MNAANRACQPNLPRVWRFAQPDELDFSLLMKSDMEMVGCNRQDMDVIRCAVYFECDAIEAANDTAQILMQSRTQRVGD